MPAGRLGAYGEFAACWSLRKHRKILKPCEPRFKIFKRPSRVMISRRRAGTHLMAIATSSKTARMANGVAGCRLGLGLATLCAFIALALLPSISRGQYILEDD